MSRSTLAALLIIPLFAAQPATAAEPDEPDAVIDLNLPGLNLNAAVESLSTQSGAVFVVAANPREPGPDVQLTGVPLTQAIGIVAAAYGVCTDARNADHLLPRLRCSVRTACAGTAGCPETHPRRSSAGRGDPRRNTQGSQRCALAWRRGAASPGRLPLNFAV